jgi:tRNA-Thr(GGU) m(6)t(6)A37 methyltransferase TsaA
MPQAIPFSFNITSIGLISTPFRQKFGIPRQPGLATAAMGKIHIASPYSDINAFRGLEQFSHIWLIFYFHKHADRGWSPLVRPPRLGGNEKIGVFASRSTFRPNSLGQSVVKLEGIDYLDGEVVIKVSGVDLLDQTPIIDIKPYIPYSDNISEAQAGYASEAPNTDCHTIFSDKAMSQLTSISVKYPQMSQLICQLLANDPRPAYKKVNDNNEYRMQIYEYDVRWVYQNGTNIVQSIVALD